MIAVASCIPLASAFMGAGIMIAAVWLCYWQDRW